MERCYDDETIDDDERDDVQVGECPGLEPIRQKCSPDLLTCLRWQCVGMMMTLRMMMMMKMMMMMMVPKRFKSFCDDDDDYGYTV